MAVNNSIRLLVTLALSSLLMACEPAQSEKDMIMDAQFCLDEATDAASADACLSKISGLDSPEAHTLRCAGGFIAAEISSPENLSKALNAISEGDGTAVLLSSLSFPNVNLVNETVASCNKSGQNGLKLIGAIAKSATTLTSLASSLNIGSCSVADLSSCDTSDVETVIGNLASNPTPSAEDEEAILQIAESIQTVYSATCATEAANEDICGQINEAAGGMDLINADQAALLQFGKDLLAEWANN